MTLPEAVKLLRAYNAWRRGDESKMLSPELIGRAIDTMCDWVVRESETTRGEFE